MKCSRHKWSKYRHPDIHRMALNKLQSLAPRPRAPPTRNMGSIQSRITDSALVFQQQAHAHNKENSKLRITCGGKSSVTARFFPQRSIRTKGVSMPWRPNAVPAHLHHLWGRNRLCGLQWFHNAPLQAPSKNNNNLYWFCHAACLFIPPVHHKQGCIPTA